MSHPKTPNDLEISVLALYYGPLEDFVSRRDTLAKQLRAAKRREDADRVKALRKPSRMAWLLNTIVHEDPSSIERLLTAITEAQAAANLRTALETVNGAVRDIAAVGARVAIRAGQAIEPAAIMSAVRAVIGDASAFGEWRAGRLVEVAESGGLDLLTAMTFTAPSITRPQSSSARLAREPSEPGPRAQPPKPDAERAKAARADLRAAEASLAKIRQRSEQLAQTVRAGEERLRGAERALVTAQAEVEVRRAELERARLDAESASADLRAAERAVAAAQERVAQGGS
jgi:septal ring factor EnvC (AmiA/AmiB activator)